MCIFRSQVSPGSQPGSHPMVMPHPFPTNAPNITSLPLFRESMFGGDSPRSHPPSERLCLLCHGLQGAHHGVPWGLREPVLPAHPQQAAEIRLPVHGRLLVRGGGGETLGMWLPRMFLSPLCHLPTHPPPLRLQLAGLGTATRNLFEIQNEGEKAGEEEAKERILSIL